MDTARNETQNKIVATAIDMIGREVNLNFTIRELAERAGVNLASVNYYFRSKENLVDEVERYFKEELRKTYDELKRSEISPQVRLLRWAERLMQELMEYPGVLFLMVTKLFSSYRQTTGVAELTDDAELMIMPIVRDLTRSVGDDPQCSFITMQLMAGVVTPVLFYHGIGRTFGIDVSDASVRAAYVKSLVDKILPSES